MGWAKIVILALKPKIVSHKYIRQISTMQNQDPDFKEVLIEEQNHQLEVDGVIYWELKTLNRVVIQDGPDAGYDEILLVHTRSMGDKIYTVHKTNQQIIELIQANRMNVSELSTFQKVWEEHKMAAHKMTFKDVFSQEEAGGFIARFRRFFNFCKYE